MVGSTSRGPASSVGVTKVKGGGIGSRRDRPVWFSPDPSPEVVAELSSCFPTVVRFPEDEFRAEESSWAASGVVAKSFGRRVQPEALVREFRWRGRFKGEIKAYGLDRGYYLLKFSLPEEREKVLGVPWVVNGQIVAVEPWRPGFVPVDGAISHATLWVRLPQLPAEYWGEAAIRRLVSVAGAFVGLDESTAARNRMGFARASVKVDLRQPLRPGTLMMAGGEQLWQRFVYENLDDLCLHCGVLHPTGAQCPATVVADGTTGGADGTGVRDAGPRLGPWVLAVRRRLPADGVADGYGANLGAPANATGAAQGGGWMNPPRVARRPPPDHSRSVPAVDEMGTGRGKKGKEGLGNPFAALAHEGEGGREGGSPCPPNLSKRARPNDFKGSHSAVQPASKCKMGSGRGHTRSRKMAPNLSKGKEVALGQDQSIQESGRYADESGVFMFIASDRGGPGFMEDCPTTRSEGGQGPVAQAVDTMLVSVPRPAERDVVQGGGESIGLGDQDVTLGSPALAHDVAVSRLRQAIQGEGEGTPAGRGAEVASADEDIMCGVVEATQIPHSVSL